MKKIKFKCDYCNKVNYQHFSQFKKNKHHFCNVECFGKYFIKHGHGGNKIIICKQCSKPKTVCNASKVKFCSRKCYSKWMALNWKGKNNPHYGHKWSEESRINMSKNWHKSTTRVKHLEKLNKTKKRFGKDNPNWQEGISFEKYGPEFNDELKQFVKRRDKYTCQNPECRIQEKECITTLRTHHIDYNKKNNDPINLIALCTSCHMKSNYNRPYWQNLYENIQIKRKVHLLNKEFEKPEKFNLC